DGVDPNPLIMPFFVFFFGFMFADLGYGIILMLASLFIQKKMKPKGTMGYMMGLMFECGAASAVIGFFTGGFFSDSIKTVCTMMDWAVPNIPFLTSGPLLDVTNDPLTVLIFCMAVGVVQLITGMAVNAYMLIRDGHWFDALCDVGTWWLVFAGIAVFAITGNWYVIAAGGVAIVLTQGRNGKGIFGKFSGILGSLYNNITGYFGDVLSYSRLMVMMLAGSVIGSIFNLLGSMPGNIFVFAVVFVVGHIFNMGLNVIGTYVHASRLQYLEFFGKFYKEGGKPFQPLNLNTKYVDIIKEEN
ncbi:MAG: V-type ATP synthase subunit I, partial [Pseudoflavonifractor sp.]